MSKVKLVPGQEYEVEVQYKGFAGWYNYNTRSMTPGSPRMVLRVPMECAEVLGSTVLMLEHPRNINDGSRATSQKLHCANGETMELKPKYRRVRRSQVIGLWANRNTQEHLFQGV